MYPAIDMEYEVLAEELNKDIRYFQKNGAGIPSQDELVNNSRQLALSLYE